MPPPNGSRSVVAALAGIVLLGVLAGCTGGLAGGIGVGPANDDAGPGLHPHPARPAVWNNSSAASYVEALEDARLQNQTVRNARSAGYTVRSVAISARTRTVGRTASGGFVVEAASSSGAALMDASGRNISSDPGLPLRSLYYVTPNGTARIALPRNWSTDTARVVLVNFETEAVHVGFQWGRKPVSAMTMNVVDGGNASTLGVVNASAVPTNATVAVGAGDVTPTVRVGERGTWTETSVFVVVLPDGSVVVTRGYVVR